jgi:hypothetical protein
MDSMRAVSRFVYAGALAALPLLCACQGRGRVEFIDLNYREIDPPAPRTQRMNVERCYWWADESGQVWIALEHEQSVLLGAERFVFQMSLVLEKLPAGHARNYLVTKRELRAAARLGPAEGRFVSLSGIVALYRESDDRLRGSFRLEVAREIGQLLGGWGRPTHHLMQGTFVAVHDEQRGRRIADECDARARPRTAASQPAAPAGSAPSR